MLSNSLQKVASSSSSQASLLGFASNQARSMSKISIAVAAGDGIGTEIMAASIEVLKAVRAPLDYHHVDMGKSVYMSGMSAGMTQEAKEKVEDFRILFKGRE
jgi:isocitrate dehydrogenase